MNCLRCGSTMYRVVNANQTAKATCTRCAQFVDCAQCSNPKCGDQKCLPCYNKGVSAAGRPADLRLEPIIPDEEAV